MSSVSCSGIIHQFVGTLTRSGIASHQRERHGRMSQLTCINAGRKPQLRPLYRPSRLPDRKITTTCLMVTAAIANNVITHTTHYGKSFHSWHDQLCRVLQRRTGYNIPGIRYRVPFSRVAREALLRLPPSPPITTLP